MKHYFVDTNILVDLVADRRPYSKHAVQLFQQAEGGAVRLYTSSHSLATTHYLLKKYLDENQLREVLHHLLEVLQIIAVDENIIKRSLRSAHPDFEDAIQMLCAESVGQMDAIFTRNVRDFKNGLIPAINPDELGLSEQ